MIPSVAFLLVLTGLCVDCVAATGHLQGDSGSVREDPRCPTLYYGKNCEHCRDDRSGSPVLCDTPLNTSYLFIDFQLYYNDSKQIIAHSIFHTNRGKRQNRTKYYRYELMPPNLLDVNNFTCGSAHRTGYMCGHCIKGYGPAAYTYYGIPCALCHHKTRRWLYYILLELGFPTIIFVLFLMFQVKITSGFMIGFVLYCQIIANIFTCSLYLTVLKEQNWVLTQIMLTLYGFWNMDFFRLIAPHFCVSEKLSTLGVVSLGYIPAVYPLLLTLVLYSLIKLHHRGCTPVVAIWRPLHRHFIRFRRFWQTSTSLIDVFATFLLLSYSKMLFVSFNLAQPITHYTIINGSFSKIKETKSMSIDPMLQFNHPNHLYFSIPASLIIVILSIIPPLVLLLYPTRCSKKIFNKFRLTKSEDFAQLVGAFQDSFKNGENGTRDYRAFSALYVIHRVFLVGTFYGLALHDFVYAEEFILQTVLYILTFAFYAYAKPYKSVWHNLVELVLLFLLAVQSMLCYLLYSGCEQDSPDSRNCAKQLRTSINLQFVLLGLPQVALVMYLLWKPLKRLCLALRRSAGYLEHHRVCSINQRLRDYTSITLD